VHNQVGRSSTWVFFNPRTGLTSLVPALQKSGYRPAGKGPEYHMTGEGGDRGKTIMWAKNNSGGSGSAEDLLHIPAGRFTLGIVVAASGSEGAVNYDGLVDAAGINHLQNLSHEAKRYFAPGLSYAQRISQASSTVKLRQCGAISVPFGGLLLKRFEQHLLRFGNPLRSCFSKVFTFQSSGNESKQGSQHKVIPLPEAYSRLFRGAVGAERLVVRHATRLSANWDQKQEQRYAAIENGDKRLLPTSQATGDCGFYLGTVWRAWISWIMGVLGVGPQILAIWPAPDFSDVSSISERWTPLKDVLESGGQGRDQPPGAREADQLLNLCTLVAQAHIDLLDLKPGDMLLRKLGDGPWEVRITDFDRAGHVGSSLPPLCHLLVTLAQPTATIACWPFRHTELARAFVGRSLDASKGGITTTRINAECKVPASKQLDRSKIAVCTYPRCSQMRPGSAWGREISYLSTKLHPVEVACPNVRPSRIMDSQLSNN